ncbi:2666_t:CDS:2, partial [Racocetra fulgida]
MLFSDIDETLSRFFTPAMLEVQCAKIKSCLNYQAISIMKEDIIRYQEFDLETSEFIKDDEDLMQILVNNILKNVDTKPYYVTKKFNKDYQQPAKLANCNINRLFISLINIQEERYDVIDERKLYGELWDVARSITQKALLANIQKNELENNNISDDLYDDNRKRKIIKELKSNKRRNQCDNCDEY